MPIFSYECNKCTHVMEVFQHEPDELEDLECEECGECDCSKLLSDWNNRTWLEAKDMMRDKIIPEARKAREDLRKGKDSAFLDIYGD